MYKRQVLLGVVGTEEAGPELVQAFASFDPVLLLLHASLHALVVAHHVDDSLVVGDVDQLRESAVVRGDGVCRATSRQGGVAPTATELPADEELTRARITRRASSPATRGIYRS